MKTLYAALFVCFAVSVEGYNYSEVIEKSLLFYEAQRSGKLPSSNRIPWRGDSMLDDKDGVIDLTGGYHDAGDHVKFNFPQAWAITTLAMGGVDFKQGYDAARQFEYLLDAYNWGAHYFLKCHSADTELYVQVGDPEADHNSWDMPERWTAPRPAYKITADKPGSDVAGEVSALFSAGSMLFRGVNNTYAKILLRHAITLYRFAYDYRAKYSDSVPEATPFYTSWSYYDEIVWAAAWLYRATSIPSYLIDAENLYQEFNLQYDSGFNWDSKISGSDVILYEATGKAIYADKLTSFCDYAINEAPRTPKGLVFFSEWRSLRALSNNVFICLQAARLGLNRDKYLNFAKEQMHLTLGDWGRSFVVGFGTNPPSHQHHRAASCPAPPAPCGWNVFNLPDPNPHVLFGALVGGPGPNDEYADVRNDAVRNEVAVDYNAAFQGTIAGLSTFLGDGDA